MRWLEHTVKMEHIRLFKESKKEESEEWEEQD